MRLLLSRVIKQDQLDWFKQELANAPKDKVLIIAVHHATFSANDEHSGSDVMLNMLDKAFAQSHRLPDAVFSGHVHNYQRFTRELNDHHQNEGEEKIMNDNSSSSSMTSL